MAKAGTRKPTEGRPLPSEAANDKYDAMDAWQTSVESRLSSIDGRLASLDGKADRHFTLLLSRMDRQFLITWAGMIAGFLGIAGLMARGFGWL